MKRKTMLIGLFAAAGIVSSYEAITNSTGAPSGVSGSPASNNQTCAQAGCHSGGPAVSTQNITISSDIPASGFQPNTDYTITIVSDAGSAGSSRIGFEASIEDANGHVGTLTPGTGNKKVGNYITHTSAGTSTSTNSKTWTFTWHSGNTTGDAEVYVASNFSNSNGNSSGDVIATQSFTLTKDAGAIGIDEREILSFSIAPNPAKNWVEVSNIDDVQGLFIYSLDGKLVKSFNTSAKVTGNTWKLNLSPLKAGTYIVTAKDSRYGVQTLVVAD